MAGCRPHPEVSPGKRVLGGWEPGFCSLPTGNLGLGLPDLEVGRLGGGPRLTQQCLGAGWESLILPGNDGGPCPCHRHPLPQAPKPQPTAAPLLNLPTQPGIPFILCGGGCKRGGSWLAGCPLKGHNGSGPLPQPSVICHLVDPEPTADLELGIFYSQKTSPGLRPGSL